ncbi:peptidoglycan DD-metalloendopeptidase family protein [Nocardioides taihuensis]|uniref:Peptidoglycan DD-metalloendopeptidase family protein n=1 Tax=Nocardioides taihuensis TaxID=1835606 RepID=A0ABW0BL49_9ACTN
MRTFPRTARRRWAGAVVATALAIGALTAPLASADDDLKDRKKHVESRIRSASHDLDESSGQYRRAAARFEAAQAELDQATSAYDAARVKLQVARVRDQEMQDKLDAAVARLDQAQADLDAGQVAVTDQQDNLSDTVVDIYQGENSDLVAVSSFLNSQTTEQLTRQEELQNVMVGREAQAYDSLRAAEVLLQVREDQVSDARDEVAVQREQAAEHLVEMNELSDQAKAARAHYWDVVRTTREAKQDAAAAKRSDAAKLAQLKKQEQRIQERIMRAAARSRGGYHGDAGGFLTPPVQGPVTSPFGWRVHPIYGYWGLHDGTDFAVSCGEGMVAVADGTVLSRYWSDVYGNRLYVGLGRVNGHYLTAVYNHATGYRVSVGEHVSRGEVVGYVGSTGWSTGCHLHFTLLVDGKAVDPMNWM